MNDWDRNDAGHPLWRVGVTGAPLRDDGDSHREGWEGIVRKDACSFCDRRDVGLCGRGSSVDHIIPRADRVPGIYDWHNFAGACMNCNESKKDEKMLLWLARRRIIRRY